MHTDVRKVLLKKKKIMHTQGYKIYGSTKEYAWRSTKDLLRKNHSLWCSKKAAEKNMLNIVQQILQQRQQQMATTMGHKHQ